MGVGGASGDMGVAEIDVGVRHHVVTTVAARGAAVQDGRAQGGSGSAAAVASVCGAAVVEDGGAAVVNPVTHCGLRRQHVASGSVGRDAGRSSGGQSRCGCGGSVERRLVLLSDGRAAGAVGRLGGCVQTFRRQASVAAEYFADFLPDFVVLDAVEDEHQQTERAVEDGEQVGHGGGALVQVQQPEGPGQDQGHQQEQGVADPSAAVGQSTLLLGLHDGRRALVVVQLIGGHGQQDEIGGQYANDRPHEAEDEEIIRTEPAVRRSAVAERIHQRRDDDHQKRKAVAGSVVPLPAGGFRLEDFDQHPPQLIGFQQHPHEGAEQQVVQQSGHYSASDPVGRPFDSGQEDDLAE